MYITTNNVVTVHATTEEFNTSYRNELIQALNDSGLQDSCSYYPPNNVSYTIPASASSGEYACLIPFEVYPCTWNVRKMMVTRALVTVCSGTLTCAPYGYGTVVVEKVS